ncbi:MAG TPA: hypothetical protein PLI05_00230 [Methanotrichaceae archaeon]|nr:hypothetical protein [Methanotrichaceae archaeon]HQF15479.1 hypothetical protein [Methanotrichaceae archaeon]HQI90214.1 hypothetical protein [Methanotrichaceae archaeon]HQJ27817.1 hypothetical protein [Methanotrichaceae archaeon]
MRPLFFFIVCLSATAKNDFIIQSSEYMEIAAKITERVDELKPKRENVLRDLEKAMLYANFPGECEYLKDD